MPAKKLSEKAAAALAGYHDCPCRDCFEIAIGVNEDGTEAALCNECEEAGCDCDGGECQAPGAYGADCDPEAYLDGPGTGSDLDSSYD